MSRYTLSPQAQNSILQIAEYTLENYGKVQRKKYLGLLRDKMRLVAKSPAMGKERPEIKAGYYSIRAEKHFIYYRIADSGIEIIDVLHQAMEPRLHIGDS